MRSDSRRSPTRSPAPPSDVVRVIIAALVAMVISIVVGPKFIEFLRRRELGQFIRADGAAGHRP